MNETLPLELPVWLYAFDLRIHQDEFGNLHEHVLLATLYDSRRPRLSPLRFATDSAAPVSQPDQSSTPWSCLVSPCNYTWSINMRIITKPTAKYSLVNHNNILKLLVDLLHLFNSLD